MPDNWGFVAAAYGIAAAAFAAYWRRLCRRERELEERHGFAGARRAPGGLGGPSRPPMIKR